ITTTTTRAAGSTQSASCAARSQPHSWCGRYRSRSPWVTSDSLDPDLAEQPVRAEQEDEDQDDERDDLLQAATDVAGGVGDEQADDPAGDHRPRHRVQP